MNELLTSRLYETEDDLQVLNYPPEVVAQVRTASEEIERIYQRRAFPFNHPEQTAIYREIKTG